MIHDIETELVISQGGIMETLLTEKDKALISQRKSALLKGLSIFIGNTISATDLQSEKMALLDILNDLQVEDLAEHVKRFQNEL